MKDGMLREKALESLIEFISSLGEQEESGESIGEEKKEGLDGEVGELAPEGKAKIDILAVGAEPKDGEEKDKMKGLC